MGRVQQQAFLCGMAAIYLFAFASLYTQIQVRAAILVLTRAFTLHAMRSEPCALRPLQGLYGSQGILPADAQLRSALARHFPAQRASQVPLLDKLRALPTACCAARRLPFQFIHRSCCGSPKRQASTWTRRWTWSAWHASS